MTCHENAPSPSLRLPHTICQRREGFVEEKKLEKLLQYQKFTKVNLGVLKQMIFLMLV